MGFLSEAQNNGGGLRSLVRRKQVDSARSKSPSSSRSDHPHLARALTIPHLIAIGEERLQHDLVSAMSDLQESSAELLQLKAELEAVKEREKEKDVKLEAIENERDLLLVKVQKLVEVESSLRDESEGKETEIRSLKKNIEELEVVLESSKVLQKLKSELEKTVETMKGRISSLESSLEEKQKVISALEMKERAIRESVNGNFSDDAFVDGEKKGLFGGSKQREWVVIGGSTVAAVAVMGLACYLRAAKKSRF